MKFEIDRTTRINAVKQYFKALYEGETIESIHKFFDDDPEHTFDDVRATAYLIVANLMDEIWGQTAVALYTEISTKSDDELKRTLKDIYQSLKLLSKKEESKWEV